MHKVLVNLLHHVNETRTVQKVPKIAESWLQVNDLAKFVLALVRFEYLTCLFEKVDGKG